MYDVHIILMTYLILYGEHFNLKRVEVIEPVSYSWNL